MVRRTRCTQSQSENVTNHAFQEATDIGPTLQRAGQDPTIGHEL